MDKKQYGKLYRLKNKQKLKLQYREWYNKNAQECKQKRKVYVENNREKIRQKDKEHYYKTSEKHLKLEKERRDKNKEEFYKKRREKAKLNPHINSNNCAKRRAHRLNATPKWLTKQQLQEIKLLYKRSREISKETGIKHSVDHIIPLKNSLVCGLHVPWNLRIIPSSENSKKKNKLLDNQQTSKVS